MSGPPLDHDRGLSGRVFWITGLSGAGKSTAASNLAVRLRNAARNVIVLDGDDLRVVYGDGLAFTTADRLTLALRHARLCQLLSRQGYDVVCATICLFHACHDWCRTHLEDYHEIYLRVPIEELCRRDPRGLYRRAMSGEQSQVVGLDLAMEEPIAPDLLIDDDGSRGPEAVAECLWAYVVQLESQVTGES